MKKMVYPLNYNNRELIYCYDMIESKDEIIFIDTDNLFKECDKIKEFQRKYHIDIRTEIGESICDVSEVFLLSGAETIEYIRIIRKSKEQQIKVFASNDVLEKLIGEKEFDDVIPFQGKIDMENTGELLNIKVPIIAVMGMGRYCDKFLSELYFRNYYINEGYNVLQFGSKELSKFFGFESIPKYVLDKKISFKERVLSLNHYVSKKIEECQPDIILIGIEEGIMPINHAILNNFGEDALVVSSAMAIDYSVIAIYYSELYDKEFFKYIDNIVKYKFDSELLAFCISNTFCDIVAENFGKEVKYYHLDIDGDVSRNYHLDYPIDSYNIHSKELVDQIVQKSINQLVENVEVLI